MFCRLYRVVLNGGGSRIVFFPDGGAPTLRLFQIVLENCMKMKEIRPTGASLAPLRIRQWCRGGVRGNKTSTC